MRNKKFNDLMIRTSLNKNSAVQNQGFLGYNSNEIQAKTARMSQYMFCCLHCFCVPIILSEHIFVFLFVQYCKNNLFGI